MGRKKKKIVRRAIRIPQNEKSPLYSFSMTGAEIDAVAGVSHIARSKKGKLLGYQRPQVKRHIREIVEYLDSDEVIFPNPIILCLPSDTVFRAVRGRASDDGLADMGTIEIPIPGEGEARRAWIVDGQQRAMALAKSTRKDMPVPVNAFAANSLAVQRDQFLRVNNSRPLPKGLITELLPEVDTKLPAKMVAKKIPSALCDVLNQHPDSPFHGLIRRSSTPQSLAAQAVIRDTSVVKMLEESVSNPSGCFFAYRNMVSGETDFDAIQTILFAYWGAVKAAFPDAWGVPATQSRLMHGAGIQAMGKLMDRVMPNAPLDVKKARRYAKREIQRIESECHWTSGRWKHLDNLRWNDIQNVPRHVRELSNFLVRTYTEASG